MSRLNVRGAAGVLSLSVAVALGFNSTPANAEETGVNAPITTSIEVSPAPRSFLDARSVSLIQLPDRAAAAAASTANELAAQRTLVRKAEADVMAAADVRRRAEELSRRFVSEHGLAVETAPHQAGPNGANVMLTSASAADPQPVRPQLLALPVQAEPDLLGMARQQAAEAEARAATERAARLAAEQDSQRTIEQAATAMSKAQAEARAASRRAAEAEARALKATAAAERRSANATSTVAAIGKDKALAKASAPVAPAANGKPTTITVVGRNAPAAKPAPGFLSAGAVPTTPPPPTFSLGAMLGLQK